MHDSTGIMLGPAALDAGSFFLLGRFQVGRAGRPSPELRGRRIKDLLGYLLLFRRRQHHREALAEALWAGVDPTQSRKHLRQALWQLQSAVGGVVPDDPLLIVESEWVRINPDARIWLDIEEFQTAFERAHGVRGRDLTPDMADGLRRAASLYAGELLEGWYQDWCVFERERYKARYLSMLEKLLEYADLRGDIDDALLYGERVLEHDRAHERTHVRMMRLHYLAGDRTAALRQFQQCVTVLERELGARPASRTVELYEQIRDDRVPTWPIDGRSDPALP